LSEFLTKHSAFHVSPEEIKVHGESIRADILANKHGLSKRQQQAIQYVLQNGKLTIKEFEQMCENVNRRTLQRELKDLVVKGLFLVEGSTHHIEYKFKP